jgi:3-oxoacyl-[acyl-carrier protein] reductase
MKLKDKVAIVTGSGRGIGEAIALLFAEEGAKIVVNSMHESTANKVLDKIKAIGGKAVAVLGSTASREVVQKMVDTAVKEFGTVDIIVNNAGITNDAILHKMTDEQWDSVIAVNLTGVFYGMQCAAKVMREKGYGKIINISSTSSQGSVGQLNYSASKAGVVAMTKTGAMELGQKGINVNCISPGMIWTDMMLNLSPSATKYYEEEVLPRLPMRKKGSALDVANLALYFASDESNFVTGQHIFCDGGMKV